jgi:lipopolysaccharide transport system permease protein
MRTIVSPTANVHAFAELAVLLARYRALMLEMAKREVLEQYAGQVLGFVWAIAHPLFLIGLYVFIFAVVFQAKVGGTYELPYDYTTYLLSGLIPWLSFQQAMTRSSTALTSHANLVKQVVFPIEILPAKAVLASVPPQIIGLVVLISYVTARFGAPPATYLLLPFLFIVQLIAMMGIALALSALTAYLRDTKDFVQVFGTVGLYIMPVFYLPDWVPALFKPVLYINPFSYMIWCYQDALYYGRFDHPWAWAVFVIGSLLAFTMGYRLFRRLKPQLGNVL